MALPIITFIILAIFVIVKRSELLAYVGKIRYSKGDLQGAIKWFAVANRIGKMSAETLRYYSYLLLRDGQLELARTVLNHASLNAKKPDVKKRVKAMMAVCEWKSGNLDLAIELTEEAMVDNKTTNLYQNLGLMYVLSGDARRALDFNLEAYDFNSEDMIIMDNLAESYALYGDIDKAIIMYDILLKEEPHFPEPYYGYGMLLAKKGEKERGIELIERSLTKTFTFLSVLQKEEVEKILEDLREEFETEQRLLAEAEAEAEAKRALEAETDAETDEETEVEAEPENEAETETETETEVESEPETKE